MERVSKGFFGALHSRRASTVAMVETRGGRSERGSYNAKISTSGSPGPVTRSWYAEAEMVMAREMRLDRSQRT